MITYLIKLIDATKKKQKVVKEYGNVKDFWRSKNGIRFVFENNEINGIELERDQMIEIWPVN